MEAATSSGITLSDDSQPLTQIITRNGDITLDAKSGPVTIDENAEIIALENGNVIIKYATTFSNILLDLIRHLPILPARLL